MMDFNAHDTPINAVAALVTSKTPKHSRRERGVSAALENQNQLSVLIQPALEASIELPSELQDFKGAAFGRLTVVAFAGRIHHPYWVVRCQCGNYEVRRHRSVVKAHPESMCMECKTDLMAKEHYDFHRSRTA